MHYVDLNVQTSGIRKNIRFLVTNIGHKDIVMGYPWMAMFEPQFIWGCGAISEKALPIIIQSVNPSVFDGELIIARMHEPTKECHLQATTSTELAIKAQQYTKQVEVPAKYQQFAKVFSGEESKHYPPKRAWDHAIEFKKDAPDTIDCKVYPIN